MLPAYTIKLCRLRARIDKFLNNVSSTGIDENLFHNNYTHALTESQSHTIQ